MEKIGRYKIKEKLKQQGAMASVYLASDPGMKREVIIKVLPLDLVENHIIKKRFFQEVEILASFEDAPIVAIHDFGEENGQPYFVMRYMRGGSLRDKINEGRLSLVEVGKIIERISSGLQAAHQKNIVHRDLKPENILLDGKGDAYLSDFGLAKQSSGATDIGSIWGGTAPYMSPEQGMENAPIDGRSDQYSLAAMLFELLTGRTPFVKKSLGAYLLAHVQEPPPLLGQFRPDLPKELETAISKALEKKPEQRFNSPTSGSAMPSGVAEFSVSFNTALSKQVTATKPAPPTRLIGVKQTTASKRKSFAIEGRKTSKILLGVLAILAIFWIAISNSGANPAADSVPTAFTTLANNEAASAVNSPTLQVQTSTSLPDVLGGGSGYLVYYSARDGQTDLFFAAVESNNTIRITSSSGNEKVPAISPDGGKILYVYELNGSEDIYLLDLDTNSTENITNYPANYQSPTWSPNGENIIFGSNHEGVRGFEIYTMNLESGELQKITDNGAQNNAPTWSPCGDRIAFYADLNGNWDIYTIAPDGSEVLQVTFSVTNERFPSWSPDCTKLAYSSTANGDEDIFIHTLTDGEITNITNTRQTNELAPSWSPDGLWLAFYTFSFEENVDREIHIIASDGSQIIQVTSDSYEDYSPFWQPVRR